MNDAITSHFVFEHGLSDEVKAILEKQIFDYFYQTLQKYNSFSCVKQPGKKFVNFIEMHYFAAAMVYTKGNQALAASILGISRGTLRTKLERYFKTNQIGKGMKPISTFPNNDLITI